MAASTSSISTDINAWREAHAHLTLAVAAAHDAVAAERIKRRYLLEEICANITLEGDLVGGSNWSRAATKAATAARRAKAAKAAAAAGGGAKKRSSASSAASGASAPWSKKGFSATAAAHKQRRESAAVVSAAKKKAALGHGFESSEDEEDRSLEHRGAPTTGSKRAPLKKRKKAALAAAAAAADDLCDGSTSGGSGKKKTKKIRLSLSAARAKQAAEEAEEAAAEADNVFALQESTIATDYPPPPDASYDPAAQQATYGAAHPPYGATALHAGGFPPNADSSYAHALYSSAMAGAAGAAPVSSAYGTPGGDATSLHAVQGHQQPSSVEDLLAQYGQQEDPPDSF